MKNCKWFDIKAAKRRSLNAHNRAARGWKKRHAECDRIARLDPIQVGGDWKRPPASLREALRAGKRREVLA